MKEIREASGFSPDSSLIGRKLTEPAFPCLLGEQDQRSSGRQSCAPRHNRKADAPHLRRLWSEVDNNALAEIGDEGRAERAAVMYTLIGTAQLSDVDPQAWLVDVLARIAETSQNPLSELPPWGWAVDRSRREAA